MACSLSLGLAIRGSRLFWSDRMLMLVSVFIRSRAALLPKRMTGPYLEAMRSGNFDAVLTGNCQSVVNAVLDVQRYLPSSVYAANYGNFEDPEEIDLYDRMLRETDPARQRM